MPRHKKVTDPRSTKAAPRTAASVGPEVRVLRRFRVVFNAVKTHFRQVEKGAGIGGAQVWALSIIHDLPEIGVNDLAQAMDVHQSTASNLVRSLVKKGLVVVAKASTDRRAVVLRALPKGVKVLQEAPAPFAGVLPQALSSLDARTLARLERDLTKLIAALGADDRAEGIPLAQL